MIEVHKRKAGAISDPAFNGGKSFMIEVIAC